MANYELKLGLDLSTFQAKLAQVVPGLADIAQNMQAAFNNALGAGTEGLDAWKAKLQSLGDDVAAFSARWKTALASLSQTGAEDEAVDRRFANMFGAADESASKFAETIGSKFNRTVASVKTGMLDIKATADQFGFTGEQSAKLSQELTQLGVQFAQFRGIADAQVFSGMQQSLMGNERGLRQFGIAVTAATVSEKAFQMGLDPSKLTEQEAVLVRVAIMKERMAVATSSAAKGEETFGQTSARLNKQLGELAGEVGRIVNEFIKPFVQYAADCVRSMREWMQANPALAKTLIDVGVAVGGLATGITGIVGAVNIGVQAVTFYRTALAALIPIKAALAANTGTLASLLPNMSGAMVYAQGAALGLGAAAGFAGAALAGWAIGKAIDDMVGFSDAAVKCAKGTSTWSDEIKTGLINILVPATAVERAMNAANVAAAKLEEQKLGEKLRAGFDAKQLEVYNNYLGQGLSKYQATMLAVNKLNELYYLHAQRVNLSGAALQRLIELEKEMPEETDRMMAAEGKGVVAIQKTTEARQLSVEEEKTYQEAVKKSELEVVRARQGETSATVEEARQASDKQLEILVNGARAQQATIAKLSAERNRLQMSPLPEDQGQFANVQRQLDEALAKYKRGNQAILNEENAFADKLDTAVGKRVEELDRKADQEIATMERVTDATVKNNEKQIAEIERSSQKILDARNKSEGDADRLLNEVAVASARRTNPAAAEIEQIKQRTYAILVNLDSEDKRQQVVAASLKLMGEQKDLAAKITDAETAVMDARVHLDEVEKKNSSDKYVTIRAVEAVVKAEATLAKTREQARGAADAYASAERDLRTAAEEGALNKAREDEVLAANATRQADLMRQNDDLLAAQKDNVAAIREGATQTLVQFKGWVDTLRQAGAALFNAAKISTGLQAPAGTEKPLSYAEQVEAADQKSQSADTAAANAKASATEAAKAAGTTATAATAANQASVNLGEGLSNAIATATGAVNNLTTQSAQLNTVTQLVPRMAESLTSLVAQQKSYADQMDNFAGVVLDKVGQTAAAFGQHAAVLANHAARIAKIEISGGEDVSLAAAGLGGG